MKLSLLCTGKNHKGFVNEGVNMYIKRIQKYVGFDFIILPEPRKKTNNPEILKSWEAEIQLKAIPENAFLVLLDEKGEMQHSVLFSKKLEQFLSGSMHHVVFLIGGAFGFDNKIYSRANSKLSLSKMTFSHQLIRLMFLEQLYRAFTIMHNEPYHNA